MFEYLMEDEREAHRLATKVNPDDWVHHYLSEHAKPGKMILSVGCGPGVIECSLARKHPAVHVTGVERSIARARIAEQIAKEYPNIRVVIGNALELPFEDCTFDFVYSRLLMQHVGAPELAIKEMVRVCKPQGHVLLYDLDGQFLWHFPQDPFLTRCIECVVDAMSEKGFDPLVGRKLYTFAYLAGLTNIGVKIEPYHQIIGSISSSQRELWELKLAIARRRLEMILGSTESDAAIDAFLSYLDRYDSLMYSIAFTVCGEKPRD